MNRFFTIFGVIVLFASSNGMAQSKKFELFGGYSLESDVLGDTPQGWNASLAAKVNPWLSVVTDFSGHYNGSFVTRDFRAPFGSTVNFMTHSAMAGPEVTMAHRRFRPFARALFGVARISFDSQSNIFPSGNNTGFVWSIGGGLDWKAFEKMRIRLIQADYLRADEVGPENNTLRVSFGLVIPF